MIEELRHFPEILEAAARYDAESARIAELCVEIQQIPAPTGAESIRSEWVKERFRHLGLADIEQDGLYNVYGRIPGTHSAPAVLVTAHTDTVFDAGTDLTLRRDMENRRLYGPGIGDNSTGVAALVLLAETLSQISQPPKDIWLVANSNEEGIGDLRGMRAAFTRLQEYVGAAVVVEGMGLGRIVHRGLGSRRFRISATAPGGHSWSDFGTTSALHVLVQLAADLSQMQVPDTPRTTFNIGRMVGGRSVNTIAQHAMLELDLRSEDTLALQSSIDQVQRIVAKYQTPTWRARGADVRADVIGDRPSGEIARDHILVRAATHALVSAGYTGTVDLRISSTDANIPLSQGVPAICVGVTEGGNAHRLEEWIQTDQLALGVKHLLYLTWWISGWLAGDNANVSSVERKS